MPFINFHSARILEPKFNKYAYKRVGNGIDMVFGLKDGKSHLQAIRFNISKFTPGKAKEWLKEHKRKYISFHPASPKKKVKEDAVPVVTSTPTTTTVTGDIARFADRVGPMVSRQGDRKKRTLRETLEYIVNDTITD